MKGCSQLPAASRPLSGTNVETSHGRHHMADPVLHCSPPSERMMVPGLTTKRMQFCCAMIGNKDKISHTINQKKGQFSSQTCRDTSPKYTESQEQSEPIQLLRGLGS